MGILKGAASWAMHNKGKAAGTGFGLWFGVDEYQTKKEEGSSTIGAVASAGFEAALPFVMGGWAYAAYEAVTELSPMAVEAYQGLSDARRQMGRDQRQQAFSSMSFNDTEMTHTMRQAGMAQAEKAKYNMQVARMGQEAKYMMK